MATTFRHFAINADDVARAKRFYEEALGLTFAAWGPPNFYHVKNQGKGLVGALQERRELVPGRRTNAFESTFGVDDLKATIAAIERGGGRVLTQPFRIEGVGELAYFEDTEGNVCGIMQYDPDVWSE